MPRKISEVNPNKERLELRVTPEQLERWRLASMEDPRLFVIPRETHRLSAWVRLNLDEIAEKQLAGKGKSKSK